MKPIDYPGNGNGLIVSYNRMREGPNYFMIYYKQTSSLKQDPKDCWKVLGSAKFTTQSQELKQWCLDVHDKYGHTDEQGRADTSFASEAQLEPNENTKMIT